MATFKAVVSPYRKSDGTYRVNIRVTHNRQHKDLPTPFYVTQGQMTRSMKIKDQIILDQIEDKIREFRQAANNIGFLAERLDIDHFINLIKNNTDKLDFFVFARGYIERVRSEHRNGTADIYECALNSIYRFNGEKPLYFTSITKDYIGQYFASLQGLKANTQLMYISKLRTIYTMAMEKYNNTDLGIIIVRSGVFDGLHLPTREYSKENVLREVKDMQAIIDAPYANSWSIDFCKDMFILAFCLLGTNIADLIKMEKSQYKDGILSYRRTKTARQSKENADIQIRVPDVGRVILEKYSGDKTYLIDFRGHARNGRFVRYIHYWFAKIGLEEMPQKSDDIGRFRSQYSFYANRHSMASFARNVCGIDYMTVHEMLNHAAPSSYRNTDAYLWKDYTHLWEANDKVMDLFDWSFYITRSPFSAR